MHAFFTSAAYLCLCFFKVHNQLSAWPFLCLCDPCWGHVCLKCSALRHQGEVSRTFLSRTSRGMQGSEKKFYSQISEHVGTTNTCFISLSLEFNADSISVKILNYTIRNREISNKMLGMLLRTNSVWDREILAGNTLFILILNNFPEHVKKSLSL